MHRLCTGQAPRYVNRCPPVLEKPGGATRDGITHADQHAAPRPWGGVATLVLRIHISLRMPTPPSAATARGRTALGEAGHYLNHKAGYPLNHLLLNNPCRPSSPQGRVAGEWLNSGEGEERTGGNGGRAASLSVVSESVGGGSPSLLSLLVSDGLFGGVPGGEGSPSQRCLLWRACHDSRHARSSMVSIWGYVFLRSMLVYLHEGNRPPLALSLGGHRK